MRSPRDAVALSQGLLFGVAALGDPTVANVSCAVLPYQLSKPRSAKSLSIPSPDKTWPNSAAATDDGLRCAQAARTSCGQRAQLLG